MVLELISTAWVDLKIVIDGILYLSFAVGLMLTAGSNHLAVLSEALGLKVRIREYDEFAELSARAGATSSILTIMILLVAILSASMQPTTFSLYFYAKTFAAPITLTLVLLLAEAVLAQLYKSTWRRLKRDVISHLFLGTTATVFSVGATLAFNLINSYTIAPPLPDGIRVLLENQRLDWGRMLALMVNQTWIPLTIKWNLIGLVLAGLILSAAAALNIRMSNSKGHVSSDPFYMTWGFKLALLFGAPIAMVGYWVAALMHVATPTVALGLMGETKAGFSSALVNTVSPLWHIGIITIVAVAAFAIAFYYRRAPNLTTPGWSRSIAIRELTRIAVILWILGLVATSATGIMYPKQATWTIYLLIIGYLQLQCIWLYSKGRLNLRISVLLFAVSCAGLFMLIGPYNKWFLAERYGGVPWPPVSFVAFVLVGYLLCAKQGGRCYLVPLLSGIILPIAVFVKLMDTALIKGSTIIPIDPTVEPIVKLWAIREGVNLTPAYDQYPFVTPTGMILTIIMAYLLFVIVFCLAIRLVHFGSRSNEGEIYAESKSIS